MAITQLDHEGKVTIGTILCKESGNVGGTRQHWNEMIGFSFVPNPKLAIDRLSNQEAVGEWGSIECFELDCTTVEKCDLQLIPQFASPDASLFGEYVMPGPSGGHAYRLP